MKDNNNISYIQLRVTQFNEHFIDIKKVRDNRNIEN